MQLSVIVGSSDGYSELWEPFQICFERYWKHQTENLFVTESKEVELYTKAKFTTLSPGRKPWGERMRSAIEMCSSKYILFLLEDYFLCYEYTERQLNEWLANMDKYSINRLQISPSAHQRYKKLENIRYNQIAPDSEYLISLQPSIWRKEFLLKNLIPEYSPWDFEIYGSQFLKYNENLTFIDKRIPTVYFNAVRRGKKKSPGWDAFFEKEELKDFNLL